MSNSLNVKKTGHSRSVDKVSHQYSKQKYNTNNKLKVAPLTKARLSSSSSSSLKSFNKKSASPENGNIQGLPLQASLNKKPASDRLYPAVSVPFSSFIFPDTRALFNLNLKSYMDLTYEEIKVVGFELYIIEQWAPERKLSTIITSLTGNSQDIITAIRVILPSDPKLWPGRFKQYHEELMEFSQPRVTPQGTLFISNLSNVNSSLNLIHIECGDLRSVWILFKINFNLKMLHCAGRSAVLLSYPSSSAKEKFSQVYRIPIDKGQAQPPGRWASINERLMVPNFDTTDGNKGQHSRSMVSDLLPVSGYYPVIELINIIQISLGYFKLPVGKIINDGLICNITKKAIDEWWDLYGKLYLGVEKPRNEATLGPTTVASLISLVLSCYFKLMVEDCISSKDAFDEPEFFNGIYNFQRKYGITTPGTQVCLEHRTLEKLFEVSAKFSAGNVTDIFKMKKVVKSRVHDITGKGNPIHLSNEILTTDLNTLVNNIHGGSLGLLWKGKGKPRRKADLSSSINFLTFNFSHGNPMQQLKEHELNLYKLKQDEKLKERALLHNKLRFLDNIDDATGNNNLVDRQRDQDLGSYNERDSDMFSLGRSDLRRVPFSSATISSMFCNYDRSKYLRNADINKRYQNEIFRRNSVDSDIQKAVNPNKLDHYFKDGIRLHRSNSASKIQNVIERWDLPFDSSVVKVARDLLRIEDELHLQQQVDEKEKELHDNRISQVNDRGDENHDQDVEFDQAMKALQEIYQKYIKGANTFQAKSDNIETQQQLLLNEMHELNSLTSKLKYDVRILDHRVRDVEESVSQFDTKLKAVRKTLVIREKGPKDLTPDMQNDKLLFEQCMNNLLKSENTQYQGVCLKVLSKGFFQEMKRDIHEWYHWFFGKAPNKSVIENADVEIQSMPT
ncbi:Stb2p NDAI_0G04690 [Naumovozyma dairenensis CBS 421]|uniref:STB6-like N-terminal domain-containing protein n=1 Tax=Naumovozyma dairenensis (strain ATCC 10597 / BCRC 20456 / CBS 421 / NBRC 0211 / NRRL Y-12639) TaxID=1071378 RepID=J7REC7_NAUDC|nr:hypothetical protein NDAI_0G04690 [Naumovozyma dairenensis CBS 421]CCK73454.1 hypothetical protein NDAI_0G04690 [Naumovozyma dairenensis CBS 421]